jgi:putative sigma-54 modulation protein
MVITTTARHLDVSEEVKAFADKRLSRLERFVQDIREAHVILTAEKYRYTAEIILRLNRHEIVTREETGDVLTSIDRAVDRLEAQLKKLRERRIERGKGQGRPAPAAGAAAAGGEDEDWDEAGLAEGAPTD